MGDRLGRRGGYLRGVPDFHLYGSDSGERLRNLATPLAIIAASAATYGDLVQLLDQHEARVGGRGERLCVSITGTALSPAPRSRWRAAADDPAAAKLLFGEAPVVFADALEVGDCVKVLAAR